jgi:hypothetical protein
VYDNAFADSDWTAYLPAGHVRLENVMFAPLVLQGKTVGLLGLSNKDGDFTERDAHVASAFGELAAIALLNSRTLEALQQSEEALSRKAADLARSNADLEHFAYVASHDLREPLRMVSGYLGLLEARYASKLDESAREFIEYAVRGAERMDRMIRALLDLSRVSTREDNVGLVDVQALVDRTLKRLDLAIEESGGVVSSDSLPTIVADEVLLGQVFQNLVDNALKFRGGAPPVVHISAQAREGEWLFAVRDNGIGLDAAQAEDLFQLFWRGHNKEKYPGTGLGLAICRKIVERHGGRIWVESEPGAGATFFFTIAERK